MKVHIYRNGNGWNYPKYTIKYLDTGNSAEYAMTLWGAKWLARRTIRKESRQHPPKQTLVWEHDTDTKPRRPAPRPSTVKPETYGYKVIGRGGKQPPNPPPPPTGQSTRPKPPPASKITIQNEQ